MKTPLPSRPASRRPRWRSTLLGPVFALLLGIFATIPYAVADDIEIYTNPANNTLRPPYTVIVLDLNLLGICNSVLTQTSNPNNPNAPQLCLNITNSIVLSDLLMGVTSNPAQFLTNLLVGNYTCTNSTTCSSSANALCDLYGLLGVSSPVVQLPLLGPLLAPLLGGVSTLTCGTLNFLLGIPLLGSVVNGLLGGFVGQLVTGLVSPLLTTVVGQLPAAVLGLLNSTFSGILNLGQVGLLSFLESILKNLINSKVAIVLSHADRSNATGSPGANCSFADLAAIPGARRTTSGCSNGAYVLVGFTSLVDQGSVTSLLTRVTTLLTNTLNPTNLLNSVTALTSTALTTPTSLLPPYQGKEVYAEIAHYLAGRDIYNGPLARWDGLTGLLTRDTTIELANGNYNPPALECRTANVLNVMLTNNIRDTESDTTLRAYFPGLPTGAITLADVVREARSPGFTDAGGRAISLNSYFVVQDLLTSTATLANTGATVLSYASSLGLLGLGQTTASLLKPTLRVDASLLTPSLTADLTQPSKVRPEAFFPLFKPSTDKSPRWDGNLKRLAVKTDSNGDYQYYDANNALAIDSSDGRIRSGALTYWTNTSLLGALTADGRNTTLGGAGQKIPGYALSGGGDPGRRNGSGRTLYYDRVTSGGFALGALDADSSTTTAVTDLTTDLGAAAETSASCGTAKTAAQVAQELLLYARGYDTGTSCAGSRGTGSTIGGRSWLHGALLHSRPVAINYGARSGYSSSNPDIRVVYGAADGFLRMVRNSDGVENWGFLPRVIASQQKTLRDNLASSNFPYGADGAPAVLIQDRNSSGGPADGKIESGNANDRAWMFFGLRRSGRHVYGMDVTNPDSPALLWRIGPDGLYRSGSGLVSGTTGDYSELALTFSTPQIGRLSVTQGSTTTTKPVLIFGGGYNGGRDASGNRLAKDLARGSDGLVGSDDSVGNAIFIVDAQTGDLIWKARQGSFSSSAPYNSTSKTFQHPLLVNSIASDLTILDTDGDGLTDRLYVADTGGRLWRGDFYSGDRSQWTLTPLASVGRHNGSGVANDRRFFHAPDYAPYRNTLGRFDVIVFGSGDREDPLNTSTENYLYAFRDTGTAVTRGSANVVTTEGNLKGQGDFADLTSACSTNTATCAGTANLATGWKYKLSASGEKVLSQPLSVEGTVFFSTYVPPDTSTQACEPSEGSSRLYGVALNNSRPVFSRFITDTDGDARRGSGVTPGLPGEFSPLTALALTANAQTLSLPTTPTYPYFWRERRGDEEKAP